MAEQAAEKDWTGLELLKPDQNAPVSDEPNTWGDYGQVLSARTKDTGAGLAASARYMTEDSTTPEGKFVNAFSKHLQKALNESSDADIKSMSPQAQARVNATVTDPAFYKHPFAAGALQTAGMLPFVGATVVGGLVAGPIGAAIAAGELNKDFVLDDIYKALDKPDDELRKINSFYDTLREAGMSEADARADLKEKAFGAKPIVNAIVGAASGLFGPAGQVARAVSGKAAIGAAKKGFAGRVGVAAGEAAATEAVEEGVSTASVQQAEVDIGSREALDPDAIAGAALTGAVLGVIPGGLAGSIHRPARAPAPTPSPTVQPSVQAQPGVTVSGPIVPDPAQAAAVAASTPQPVPTQPAPAPAPAPAAPVAEIPAPAPAPAAAPVAAQPVVPPVVKRVRKPKAEVTAEPVTSEVTPDLANLAAAPEDVAPVAPAAEVKPEVVAEPVAEAPTGPRILRDVTPEGIAREAEVERVSKEAQDAAPVQNVEEKERGVGTGHRTDAEKDQSAAADSIFEDEAPATAAFPTDDAGKKELFDRLDRALKRAKDEGIKVKKRVGAESTGTGYVWLAEASSLHAAMQKKSFVGALAQKRITSFLSREAALRAGETADVKAERKSEGETRKVQSGGTGRVEAAADTKTPEPTLKEGEEGYSEVADAGLDETSPDLKPSEKIFETEAVKTDVASSAKGSARGIDDGTEKGRLIVDGKVEEVDRAKAASGVRKVEITPEMRAKYEGTTPKVEAPKAPPKVEAAKAVAKKPVTSKVKAVKDKVAAAAAKVDTKPTEAQKESGNYEKGHVSVQGLNITIENPKGSERSGTDAGGKPWSVKMPDHYGYVKRTEGADGDQVDVYVGPNPDSKHVIVIDQQDPDTKKFDEHKAMLGYNDGIAAMDAYEKAFSDGRGLDRIQKMTPMSMEDFKTWLKEGDTKKSVGEQTSSDPAAILPRKGPEAVVDGPPEALYTTNTREVLNALNLSDFKGIPGMMAPFMRRRLLELVGDTPVRVVSLESMADRFSNRKDLGPQGPGGYYSPSERHIVLRHDVLSNSKMTAIVMMHEAVHAATARVIETNANARLVIRQLMGEVREFLDDRPDTIGNDILYSLKSEHEFMAEALTSPDVQNLLVRVDASPALIEALDLGKFKRVSVWDAMVQAIRKWLGLPDGSHTALEAVMRVGSEIFSAEATHQTTTKQTDSLIAKWSTDQVHAFGRDIESIFKRAAQQEQQGSPKLLKVMTGDQIAQLSERFFNTDVVRRIVDLGEIIRVEAHKLLQQSEPVVSKLAALEHKYKGPIWEQFTTLVHDETVAGVYADKALNDPAHDYLGKDRLDTVWAKEQHARLAGEYATLPEDLRQARKEALTYYTDQQNAMSLSLINNKILRALGVEDAALAGRIHTNTTTLADVNTVGGKHVMDTILDAKELAKIKGPYFPLMRQGDWVVRGTYKVTPPANALRQIERNVWEFAGRDQAIAFTKKQDTPTDIKSRWVDKTTGETFVIDPKDGKEVKVSANDTNAEQRFRVTVQDEHVEFFESKKEALEAAADYEKSPAFANVKGVEPKKFEPGDRQSNLMSHQLQTLMGTVEKRQQYKDLSPSAKNEVLQALNIASIKYLGSTRIQSRRLPRRRVAGYSTDVVKNSWDYAQSVSGYRAKLKHEPALEAARKEMLDSIGDDATKSNSMGRRAIANEMIQREATNNSYAGKQNPWVNRALTTSFLDKLWGPSHNIINAMQVGMVAMPYLAGRHGVARAFTEIGKAYNDIAGWSIVKQGLRETVKGFKGEAETPSYAAEIRARLTDANEKEFIDYVVDRGSLDPDAGLEIAELLRSRGKGVGGRVDQGLGYLEGIARQMPRAIETINRTATGLAAFRLEMSKSGDKAKALRYGQEAINNTQGNYSATNAAPIFNHPLAKLSLQFKKYGQMIYHLLGQQVGKALRNASPGDRAEAIKTLALLTTTHVAMAGALGLPTEPLKWLLMGAKAAGLTAVGWGDVENWERQALSSAFGKTGGEIAAKGLPRAIGIDLSSRVGLDNLVGGFGEPKSDKKNDVKAWVMDTLVGAPGALGTDYVTGANALMAGEFYKAAEMLVPMKMAADAMKAYRMGTEGKKTENGRQLTQPYTGLEMATRVMGFTPAREAEEGAKAAAFRAKSAKSKTEREAVIAAWVGAKGPDKVKAQRAVQEFNKTAHANEKISPKDLTGSQKRRDAQGAGVVTNRRNEHILQRMDQVYNTP